MMFGCFHLKMHPVQSIIMFVGIMGHGFAHATSATGSLRTTTKPGRIRLDAKHVYFETEPVRRLTDTFQATNATTEGLPPRLTSAGGKEQEHFDSLTTTGGQLLLTHKNVSTEDDRFSWREMQDAYGACYAPVSGFNKSGTKPLYLSWESTSSLGNALNCYAGAFVTALSSGRELIVGNGAIPTLLCDPVTGIFVCGIKHFTEVKDYESAKKAPAREKDPKFDTLNDVVTDILKGDIRNFQWRNTLNHISMLFRGKNPEDQKRSGDCILRAMRCDQNHMDLEGEACVMTRMMQLLLPGARLRPDFTQKAMVTAKTHWLGRALQLRKILASSAEVPKGGVGLNFTDSRYPHMINRRPTVRELAGRFPVTVHIRAQPPELEKNLGDIPNYEKFRGTVAQGQSASGFWTCLTEVAKSVGAAYKHEHDGPDLFLATDMQHLCVSVNALLDNHTMRGDGDIACMTYKPAHMTKSKVEKDIEGGLHSHENTLLDWYLLSKSASMVSLSRLGSRCEGSGKNLRASGYGVSNPGKSFVGWALALSGNAVSHKAAQPPIKHFSCGCGVQMNSMATMAQPDRT